MQIKDNPMWFAILVFIIGFGLAVLSVIRFGAGVSTLGNDLKSVGAGLDHSQKGVSDAKKSLVTAGTKLDDSARRLNDSQGQLKAISVSIDRSTNAIDDGLAVLKAVAEGRVSN